jgi:hypothetical protein
MKISELPKEIRKKALEYQKKDGQDLKTDNLKKAFAWYDTKEGGSYWVKLDSQKPPKKEIKDSTDFIFWCRKNNILKLEIEKFLNEDETISKTLDFFYLKFKEEQENER